MKDLQKRKEAINALMKERDENSINQIIKLKAIKMDIKSFLELPESKAVVNDSWEEVDNSELMNKLVRWRTKEIEAYNKRIGASPLIRKTPEQVHHIRELVKLTEKLADIAKANDFCKRLVEDFTEKTLMTRKASGTLVEQFIGHVIEFMVVNYFLSTFPEEVTLKTNNGYDGGVDFTFRGEKIDIKGITRNFDFRKGCGWSQINYSDQQAKNTNVKTDYLIAVNYNKRSGYLEIINMVKYPKNFENAKDWRRQSEAKNDNGAKIQKEGSEYFYELIDKKVS